MIQCVEWVQLMEISVEISKNENHELKVNNSSIIWKPMSVPEDRSQETGKRQVANVWFANGVKGAELITFWRASDSYCHGDLTR